MLMGNEALVMKDGVIVMGDNGLLRFDTAIMTGNRGLLRDVRCGEGVSSFWGAKMAGFEVWVSNGWIDTILYVSFFKSKTNRGFVNHGSFGHTLD